MRRGSCGVGGGGVVGGPALRRNQAPGQSRAGLGGLPSGKPAPADTLRPDALAQATCKRGSARAATRRMRWSSAAVARLVRPMTPSAARTAARSDQAVCTEK